MAKKVKSKSWLLIVAIVAFSSWIYQRDSEFNEGFVGQGLNDVSELKVKGDYEVLNGCSLTKNRRNDGDSFFVKHPKGETEFRLYYVDAPESRYREYANGDTNGKRIHAQGTYFGGLDRETTTDLGAKGKRFVADLLGSRPFSVITRWENVFSPERRYAFVIVEHHGKQVFLHEILIEMGYARIHTKPATMPDGGNIKLQLKKLRLLEKSAKNAKLGGWQ
jgi:endonuclease YncB( thermonuclease family)